MRKKVVSCTQKLHDPIVIYRFLTAFPRRRWHLTTETPHCLGAELSQQRLAVQRCLSNGARTRPQEQLPARAKRFHPSVRDLFSFLLHATGFSSPRGWLAVLSYQGPYLHNKALISQLCPRQQGASNAMTTSGASPRIRP